MKTLKTNILTSLLALFVSAAAALSCMSALTSCSSKHDSPDALAEAAMKSLMKKDIDGYMALTSDYDKKKGEDDKAMLDFYKAKISSKLEEKGGVKEYEVIDRDIKEEKATLKLKMYYGDGSEDTGKLLMKKVDGKWWLAI